MGTPLCQSKSTRTLPVRIDITYPLGYILDYESKVPDYRARARQPGSGMQNARRDTQRPVQQKFNPEFNANHLPYPN